MQWCSCHGTSGEQNEISNLSDSDSSLSPVSDLETEFPVFPRALEMEQRNQGLPPDLLELLDLMTDRLQQHDQIVAGPQEQMAYSHLFFMVPQMRILMSDFNFLIVMPLLMGGPLNRFCKVS